jgi:hypothetical protein
MTSDPAVPVLLSRIRDHSYRDTALGQDVVNFLDWKELGGAAGRRSTSTNVTFRGRA